MKKKSGKKGQEDGMAKYELDDYEDDGETDNTTMRGALPFLLVKAVSVFMKDPFDGVFRSRDKTKCLLSRRVLDRSGDGLR